MSFAIFYELSDLSAIAGSINAQSLSNTLRQRGRTYWNNGLSGWETTPLASSNPQVPPAVYASAPLAHICIITQGTLAAFRQYLLDVAAFLAPTNESALYLISLSNDMANLEGAIEPWPPI